MNASKRAVDVLGAAAGLLLLMPVGMLIAVVIRADSPGPVLFRQTRVGLHGKPFTVHKFRTMHAVARAGDLPITLKDDPRVTRAGRWLRRTKLDELPQLVDVLRGAMSLVGPRPEVPQYVALYPAELRDKILSVRPGLTDPATLAFRDESRLLDPSAQANPEATYTDTVLPAKLRLSAQYIDRANGWHDLQVIAATVKWMVWR
ncbi:MAG: sugar transferase [Pseudomonadota bacterium]